MILIKPVDLWQNKRKQMNNSNRVHSLIDNWQNSELLLLKMVKSSSNPVKIAYLCMQSLVALLAVALY